MAKHFLSVCIFCFLCATHSPCESHVETNHSNALNHKSNTLFADSDEPPLLQSDQNSPEKLLSTDKDVLGSTNLSAKHFLSNTDKYIQYNISNNNINSSKDKFNRSKRSSEGVTHICNNSSNSNSDNDKENKEEKKYLKKIFAKYGDGKTMTMDGFETLLHQLDLVSQVIHDKVDPLLSHKNLAALISHETENMTDSNFTCLNHEELVSTIKISKNTSNPTSGNIIDDRTFQKACPAILYNIIAGPCTNKGTSPHLYLSEAQTSNGIPISVWVYSNLAVLTISGCGLLSVAVIPLTRKKFYQPLLQFLVALAVGTLSGDAFLHLLPHAMMGSLHGHGHDGGNHDETMWKGFVAMMGLILFFMVERIIILVAKWRKERQLKEKVPKMKVMKEGVQTSSAGDKQCKHKYSSIPYCYDAIAMIDKNHTKEEYPVFRLPGGQDSNIQAHNDSATATTFFDLDSAEAQPFNTSNSNCNNKIETNQNMTECPSELNASNCTEVNKMLGSESEKDDTNSVEYTVILREHENRHHGHSHAHGHVHAAPKSMSSVAWMVIMGDGLHNFTDGMAIGAAFSSSIAGGFSTTVAVLCHELPHELGDFAMLLKAGMSIKQALFYNLLSSILCVCGNIIGVWLGNTVYASSWVFALAAGTFVYIALVDMIPELASGHEDEGSFFQCVLQLAGLLVGLGIMTFIALYEHDLKSIFHEPL